MSLFTGMHILSSGMSAQRTRMNIVSSNLANAQTTRTEEGGPYRRKDPVFASTPASANAADPAFEAALKGVAVSDVVDDPTPFPVIHDPGHPDADANGFVQLPNVNVVEEMVNMITAARSFEANVSAMQTLQQMVNRSLEIGR
jgi:flagellar basal-body rod protein FlgC